MSLIALILKFKSLILFVHSFKEKSQFSKSYKNETDIKQPNCNTKITIYNIVLKIIRETNKQT